MVVPGEHYRAGGLHRFIFGTHYRKLWTTPLPAEIIDMKTFSGGLTVRRRGGGRQTRSLRLQGADGRRWKFRSVDKDPSAVLPPELRDTFVDAIVQDQISAANPVAPLVTDALSEAAGVPYTPHRVVVLPDDPALGDLAQPAEGVAVLEVHFGQRANGVGTDLLEDVLRLDLALHGGAELAVDVGQEAGAAGLDEAGQGLRVALLQAGHELFVIRHAVARHAPGSWRMVADGGKRYH